MNHAFALDERASGYHDDHTAQPLLRDVLADAVNNRLLFPSATDLRGFSRHQHKNQLQFSVQTAAGAFFIKCQDLEYLPHFAAEQECLLRMLATQTMAACAPLALGSLKRADMQPMSYLILQHIPLAVHGDWFSAGQQLAQMHHHTTDKGYGFERMTWCGETAQDNRWNANWCDFFIGQRLQPLLTQLLNRGIRLAHSNRALQRAKEILDNHQPEAALLHGDLWSGNIGFNPDKHLSYPVLFDPASYYGDAETDLAMTELFGRFPKKFYDGYESVNSSADNHEQRKPVYQLYHLLNHALLFGGSYIPQAESLMAKL